jgi:hypothetical protein
MIFVKNPSENEPGVMGIRASRFQHYNFLIQAYTVRYAMLDWLLRDDMRSGIWREVTRTYFSFHSDAIVSGVKRWASSNNKIRCFACSFSEGGPGLGAMFVRRVRQPGGLEQDLLKQLTEALSRLNHQKR